jgi:hypothetical protein
MMAEEEHECPGQASDKNDFSYATGRARALESKVRDVEAMAPEQAIKEYSLNRKDPDFQLELLMEKSLAEFANSAPEAVRPFRLMADLFSMKAFIRRARTGEELLYSKLGTLKIRATDSDIRPKLKDAGYPELAENMKQLLGMKLRDADLYLESYFTGRIENRLFLEYLEMTRSYLTGDETSEDFYRKLKQFIRESSMLKSMHVDVATAFLLQKQRELALARAKALEKGYHGH